MTDQLAPLSFTTFGPEGTRLGEINNNGEMVGTVYSLDQFFNYHAQGFIFSNGTFTAFDVPGADNTSLTGINDQGDIIGQTFSDADPNSPSGFLYSGGAFTPITFTVSDATTVYPTDINDQGQIAGYFLDPSFNDHGFVLDGGVVTQFDYPNGDNDTFISGINDTGVLVGYYSTGGGLPHAIMYEGGTFTTIDAHTNSGPGEFNVALDVNDWGQAVGDYVGDNGKTHGFIYQNGQFYSFDAPVIPGFSTVGFSSINNLGQVGGTYTTLDGTYHSFTTTLGMNFTYDVTEFDHAGTVPATSGDPASFGTEIRNSNIHGDFVGRYSTSADPGFTGQSFVSTGGVVSDLTFAQATFGVDARDINDPGQIAGNYLDATGEHGFLYSGGTATTVDDPNGDAGSTEVMGMNNAGQVIGTYAVGSAQHAFVWSSAQGFTDLDLSRSGAGSNPILALDINDSGQIVGTYVDITTGIEHGFLLNNGQFTSIAFPGAVGFGSGVDSINNAGQIAGFYLGSDNHVHSFVYSGGVYSTVDMPDTGGAYGIANNGTVAGSSNDGSTHHGYLAEISGATYVPVVLNTAVWLHGVDGNFDDATGWRSGTVPDAGGTVFINKPHDFTVTMDTDHTVNKIHIGTVSDDRATLAIHDANLQVNGGLIDVPGTLTLDSDMGHGASLLIGANTTILGGCGCEPDIAMGLTSAVGPITIGAAASVIGDVRILNEAYIAGQGQIGDSMTRLVNGFQIEAQGGTLTIDTGDNRIINGGLLDANPGSTLDIKSDVNNFGQILSGDPAHGGAAIDIDGTVNNYGAIGVAAGSILDIGGPLRNYSAVFAYGKMTVTGAVFNDSTAGIIIDGGSLDITGDVINRGTMQASDDSSITVHGQLLNNGGSLIADGSSITVDTLRGGSASIVDDGTLDFGGATGTAVGFSGSQGGSLILEDSGDFKGGISGFDDTDMITLKDLMIGADTKLAFNQNNGVLRVIDNGGVEARLHFDGSYALGNFGLGHDSDGHVTIQHV